MAAKAVSTSVRRNLGIAGGKGSEKMASMRKTVDSGYKVIDSEE